MKLSPPDEPFSTVGEAEFAQQPSAVFSSGVADQLMRDEALGDESGQTSLIDIAETSVSLPFVEARNKTTGVLVCEGSFITQLIRRRRLSVPTVDTWLEVWLEARPMSLTQIRGRSRYAGAGLPGRAWAQFVVRVGHAG